MVDDTKPIDKPKKKQKKAYNLNDLFNDDPFSDLMITNNPFERKMDKVNNKEREIERQSSEINSKHQKLMSEPEADAAGTHKIHDYPMIKATLGEFRKDELKLSKDKLRQKNHSTDYLKPDSTISQVTKRRFL